MMENCNGKPRPLSDVSNISSASLRELYLDWLDKKGSNIMPPYGAIDVLDHHEQAACWVLLDVVEDGQDYLIRLLGSDLVSLIDFDPTRLKLSEAQARSEQMTLLANTRLIYDQVVAERRPILDGPIKTTHTEKSFFVMESINLPFGPADGPVTQVLGGVSIEISS